jgi:cell division protein FtsL
MERVRNLTQAYSQTPWRKQTMFIGLFLLVVTFAALVAGIYLDVTARTATIGREIQVMDSEIEALKMVNADLESKWAFTTSSEAMEKRAHSLGFERVKSGELEFILVPGYLQRQHARLAPPPGPVKTLAAALPSVFTESLFTWFQRSVLPMRSRILEVRP